MATDATEAVDGCFGFPLSYAQRRLWLLDQLFPGTPLYNLPLVIHLGVAVDRDLLERALVEMARRHEMLRTSFRLAAGEPVQVIAAEPDVRLRTIALDHLPPAEREAAAMGFATDELHRPFTLSEGPPWRATLVRLDRADHLLLLTAHHIISDGWSMGLMLQELQALYAAQVSGRPSPLPELPLQYVDYAIWQHETLSAELLDGQLAYWREKLAELPVLELPADRRRPPLPSLRGRRHYFGIGAELRRAIERLSRQEGVTPFMTLFAAFALLLHRSTGQVDLPIGTPIAGRNRQELERLIGFFVNTLVLRVDLAGDPTFRTLVHRVREVALEAYTHQDLPFEKLVEHLQPARDLARNPLFQVMFALQNAPTADRSRGDGGGAELRSVEIDTGVTSFDLALDVWAKGDAYAARFEYSLDLFADGTIERMAGRWLALLEEVVADPDRHLADVALATAAERRELVERWNGTAVAWDETTLHALVEERARTSPRAVAVVEVAAGHAGDGALTYGELDERAGRLACLLRAHGVEAEQPVVVLLERSPALVVSLLAVWKAGGVYVPVDPQDAPGRLRQVLEDASPAAVVTSRADAAALRPPAADPEHGPGPRPAVLYIDDIEELQPDGTPPAEVAPHHLAYLLYTSGSTGRPKGVMVEHRALVNHLRWMQSRFPLAPGDRLLQTTHVGFDVSLWELVAPLAAGATLLLPAAGEAQDPRRVVGLAARHGVCALQTTPAFLGLLLDEPELAACHALRWVLCGAESLPRALAERFAASPLGAELHNMYGPTESAIDAASYPCPQAAPDTWSGSVPVGWPIANVRLYVLDERLRPVPPGIPGELSIAGLSLARGYWRRPDLTAERFVPDPYGPAGARMYRTGDRARWLAGGDVELLGRVDRQVKVRGVRVEPGEIEAVLATHPDVREAAVSVQPGADGALRLVAWAVAGQSPPSTIALRRFLQERLPSALVPSAIVAVPSLPRTSSGKVDLGALARLDPGSPSAERAHRPPRDEVEAAVAEIWQTLLGVPRVGIDDDFFELGGHSLLAIQVLSRLLERFAVGLPLRAVFEQPTVAGLAARLAAVTAAPERRPGTLAPRAERGPAPAGAPRVAPMSFAQQRLWFLDRLVPGNPFYNVDAAIRLRGDLDGGALERSLREICTRHGTLRTTFGSVEGRPVQIVHPRSDLELRHLSLRDLADPLERERRAVEIVREEARRPFDLGSGPVVRAALLALDVDDHVLMLTLHHIVADGWSMGVLINELAALYDAFRHGAPSPLPPLPIQYADYAEWQRDLLQGEVLQEQIEYWRRRLDAVPQLELPTDRPRPAVPTFLGERLYFDVPAAAARGLRELARQEGATLFMVLLAAFQALLHRYSGQDDVVVGTPIAGRDRAELEPLVGFFVNTLVLRSTIDGDEPFRAFLGRVREGALDAFAHRDLPFERLVEELQPERDLSRNPLCQVVLALQNAPTSTLALPGLEVSFPSISNQTTRFDLVLDVWEAAGDEALHARLEHSRDLFVEETVAALGRHLVTLLEAIALDPDRPVGRLPLLTAGERRRLLVDWNDTAADFPADRGVHHEVAARAAAAPDRVAVTAAAGHLTYGELDRRADRLARRLQALGVRPGSLVAVCLEPSPDWVIALYGVLRTGAAYVALDPATPAARLEGMLHDAAPAAVVTRSALAGRCGGAAGRLLEIDRDAGAPAAEARPAPRLDPDALAYVVYTSGSTGLPNGVLIEHRGLQNLVAWHRRAYGVGPDDRASQVAGPGFDASVWELWPYLAAGASVHVAPPELRADPPRLLAWLEAERVTLAFLATPLAEAALAAGPLPPGLALRALLTGGDRLRRAPAEPLPFPLVNHYGPSECTVVATAGPVAPEPAGGGGPPPIGRPIANTQVAVVDGRGEPVPPRVPGELVVAGAGLARGYLRRPELTARRFVGLPVAAELPAANGDGGRVYRTGDRARWRHDGQLEFLGRVDAQVSVRGFRIEPGDVEAALARHSAVGEAVVAPRPDPHGEARLVAYLVRSAADRRQDGGASSEHVQRWQTLYDQTYGAGAAADPTFDVTGWHSSYTGLPIPEPEMREWVEATAALIRRRRPRRVLEIGCGTGLLLHRLAPACDEYVGTDFSAVALARLAAAVAARGLANVRLVEARADEVEAMPGAFDAVVLNSIVQYFPGAEYLLRVLDRAISLVRPGGFVLVGDVRSLPLQRAFHLSVELHRAPAATTAAQLAQRVRAAVAREEELVVSPRLFAALAADDPRVSGVSVGLERGRSHNELTRFRYDVVIDVGDRPEDGVAGERVPWLDWQRDGGSLERVARLLERRPATLVVRDVPNARLERENRAMALLSGPRPPGTVGELREALLAGEACGVDPEHVAALGGDGYEVELLWSHHGADGRFDARFRRRDAGDDGAAGLDGEPGVRLGDPWAGVAPPAAGELQRCLLTATNDPLQASVGQRLIPELRRFLRDRLPEHMVPSSFVFLDALPLTPNGKVDRRALPDPAFGRDGLDGEEIAPRTPVEEVVAGLWTELLGVERVGVRDNFFELGGHSLLGTQLVARMRDIFGLDLPVRRVFDAPTVEGLAAVLLEDPERRAEVEQLAAWTLTLGRMSDDEVAARLGESRR